MRLALSDIERAWELKDPALVDYIVALANQDDPDLEQPVRDEALTFDRFLTTIFSWEFRQKTAEEQKNYRIEQLYLLASDNAEVVLPERLKLHKIILLLWSDDSYYARSVLIDIIRAVPVNYGAWRALKHIYKAAEKTNDYQLLGEIAARFDGHTGISAATIIYMRRRAWRYLRKLGESLPACYPEAAINYLAAYTDATNWQSSWVANHIFYHETKRYSASSFGYIPERNNALKHWAFAETWQRSPEPLLRLITIARSEHVRHYACSALKQDFKVALRDVQSSWILRFSALPQRSKSVDNVIVWLLKNSPKLEQHQFHDLGLHDAVVVLLQSDDKSALEYAIAYVKAHARDLALSELLRLSMSSNKNLVNLVQLLISERHPRDEIGLKVWGNLLERRSHHQFSASALIKYFGRKELDADWFQSRLINANQTSFGFVKKNVLQLHRLKDLGIAFFQTIAEGMNPNDSMSYEVAEFIIGNIEKIGAGGLSIDFLQTQLLNPAFSNHIIEWLDDSVITVNSLPLEYLQALVYEPDWESSAFVNNLKASKLSWSADLDFNEALAEQVRAWLSDIRLFSPADLGFKWLMTLVNREESRYHQFAVDLMIKAFLPADFSPQREKIKEINVNESGENTIDKGVDLEQKTYLFTGKLKAMTRKEAQTIVTDANGLNHKAVNGKLNFLVIGDEGSPMYGYGRKGSKQLKAEALVERGTDLKVISETAFLQMMAGEQREFSEDSILEGCETLWGMLTEKPDTPISKFALQYIRHHHPDICLKLTDRPVDPGAEIPASFATFEQFKILFTHASVSLRQLALEYAKYEFTAWQPASADLIALCESKYGDVREFVSHALLAEPEAGNKRYLIDASQLEASAVYSLCESKKPETRQLGMQIIQKHEKFQRPESLFQLTESPDRELRSFVVRIIWSLYRRYSTTPHWKPSLPVMAGMLKREVEQKKQAEENLGNGLPQRPDNLPADKSALQFLLKRWLYELPPGRLSADSVNSGLKPLSASAAKKALIETFRDIAIDDGAFAEMVLPLFENFTQSRGAMEQAACLVAVTRIHQAHPDIRVEGAL